MTDDQRRRIHDIEYSCDSREELAERIVGLEDENATLVIKLNAEHIVRQNVEAENAKLREERDMYRDLVGCMVHPDIPDQLYAENAKLRELMRDMWCCISHIGEYDIFYYDMAEDGCGMSCTVNGEHCCADKLHDRMRELGIEVNG